MMQPRASRILVVDDDPALRETLREVLTDEGYDVRQARDGREALDALGGWEADLVLLDVMMPVMGAYAFRAGQRELGGPVAPILILSAAPGLPGAGSDLDAAGVIAKPFSLDELLARIAAVLADRPGAASHDGSPTAPS